MNRSPWIVACDIDGTIYRHADTYQNLEFREPRRDVIARLQAAHHAGALIAYVTGRTHAQLRATTIHLRDDGAPPGIVLTQARWRGPNALQTHKFVFLHALGPIVYIGDTELDSQAARLACVPFVHVDEFVHGGVPAELAPSIFETAEVLP